MIRLARFVHFIVFGGFSFFLLEIHRSLSLWFGFRRWYFGNGVTIEEICSELCEISENFK